MPLENSNLVRAVKDALRRFQDRGFARFRTSEVVTEIVATGFWDAGNVRWAEVDQVIRLYHYGQGVHKATFGGPDSQWAFGSGGPARSRQM